MTPPRSEPLTLTGRAGALEAIADLPDAADAPAAFMVVCHPHPLHGGTMTNKVVTTLARCAHLKGVPTLRFNYRGVGASAGTFDEGRGELDDALTAVAAGRQRWPDAELWLAGFSFGGIIALRAATHPDAGKVSRLITVAPALGREFSDPASIVLPSCPWLIVQGDSDEVIDGALVIDWATRIAPAAQLAVLPNVGHYFHGRLADLTDQVTAFLSSQS